MKTRGKLLVTHVNPDLDAIASIWLLQRFLASEYGEAAYAFVPAGETYRKKKVDSDPDVVHVDTGLGMFDHHDEERNHLSATHMVWMHILKSQPHLKDDKAVVQMVEFVTDIDHFGEYYWPEPVSSRYGFMLSEIIPRLHLLSRYSNAEVVEMVLPMMDAVYKGFGELEQAKEAIKVGEEFMTIWGKAIYIETGSDGSMKVAQKMGYEVVVRRDPVTGYVKIKSAPKKEIDLRPIYDRISELEDSTRWYFHPSGNMLLNGSSKDPGVVPTSIDVGEIVEIIKQVKS